MAGTRVLEEQYPDVAPTGAPGNDFQRIQTSPAMFGGAVAGAEEKLGAGLKDVATNADNVAQFYSKITADDAYNKLDQQYYKIQFGDSSDPSKPGYFALKGQDALKARQGVEQRLEEARQQLRSQLNPYSQLVFDQNSRRLQSFTLNSVGRHADQQFDVYTDATQKAGIDNAVRKAGAFYNDDNAWLQSLKDGGQRVAELVHAKGLGDEEMQSALNSFTTRAVASRVEGMLNVDPMRAKAFLDEQKPHIDPQVYDSLVTRLRPMVAGAGAPGDVDKARGTTPAVESVKGAILGQESGNRSDVGASVDGARGPGQVMPATFAQYARPGERIDNPADNRAVSGRIVEDYYRRYGGDAQRVAVAYFSGPGNVAPEGSSTPWRRNVADGNGKTVASYVGDVSRRVGQKGAIDPADAAVIAEAARLLPPQLPGTETAGVGKMTPHEIANGYGTDPNAPRADTVAGTPQQSLADVPSGLPSQAAAIQNAIDRAKGDPLQARANVAAVKELYVAAQANYVEQERAQRVAKQQRETASDTEEDRVMADLYSPNPKMTVQQIMRDTPDNPLLPAARIRMVAVANAANKAKPTEAVSRETTNRMLDRMRRPEGDPSKLTDPNVFTDELIGKNITRSDYEFLKKQWADARTPTGEKLNTAQADFIKRMTSSITKSNPLMGEQHPDGDKMLYDFNYFVSHKMDEYRKAGKDPFDLLDPAKPEYLGNPKTMAPFQRTMQESMTVMTKMYGSPVSSIDDAKVLQEAEAAFRAGHPAPSGALAAEPPPARPTRRLPGETPAQYLGRTGGATRAPFTWPNGQSIEAPRLQ